MKTQQPVWQLVASLGDVHPIEYGGHFVFVDTTGVYAPEAEVWFPPETDAGQWEVRRYCLEACTFVDGVLSDNKYHPESPAWFQDDMGAMCNSNGTPLAEWVDMICHGNAQSRAIAWEAIGSYHGFENLDQYPLTLNRAEMEERLAWVQSNRGESVVA